MLPPKLAQILINLAGGGKTEKKTVLDPFCGSGTILTEAALMGYKNMIGSDESDKAVQDTQKNLEWSKEKYGLENMEYRLENIKTEELDQFLNKESVDLVATEPYLGPQRGKIKTGQVVRELEELYSRSLKEIARVLKKGGQVAMVWPVFENGTKPIDPDIGELRILKPLPEKLGKNKKLITTSRNTIVYSREGQKVWREIVILQK